MSALTSIIRKNDIIFFYVLNRKFHCRMLDTVVKSVTQLGSTVASILFSLFLLLYNRNMGMTLITNLVCSQLMIHIIKRVVNRPRPYKTLEWAVPINPPKCRYSLPSGHSGAALTTALVFGSFFPAMSLVFLSLAILTGLSRIYLGVHYPTDVVLGFAIALVTFKILAGINLTFLLF